MKRKKPFYMGNYPNSPNYDPNLPIGTNKWDLMEVEDDDDNEQIDDENNTDEWEKE